MEVFARFHQIPFSKMLTFYRKEPFDLEAKYVDPATPVPDFSIGRKSLHCAGFLLY